MGRKRAPFSPAHLGMIVSLPLLLLATSARADAFGHGLQLGIDVLYAQQFDAEQSSPGGGGGARLRYEFNDAIGITARATWAAHSVRAQESPLLRQVITASLGAVWAIDVLAVVPFIGVDVGTSVIFQDAIVAPSLLIGVGGGFDWSISDLISVGLGVSYQWAWGVYVIPPRLEIAIRVSWRWDLRSQSVDESTSCEGTDGAS